ncbi:hypothetical protein JRQ81_011483 [Phrynocephalus forsythii]|uniref:Uncharacterized protein n=1 Tax=Phrynocephalus forsythii TaxID=171643 RepID=A0A9Q0X7X8_9SAUR|nr:hypothetical protein JRQ81_011483 [Phrynocephalus forsythii]
MKSEDRAPLPTDRCLACLAMECVQVSPMQQQPQGKPTEGDHLLLLLPPSPTVQKEEESPLRGSDPWAASRAEDSQAEMKLEDAPTILEHVESTENFRSRPGPVALRDPSSTKTVDQCTACSSKENSEETVNSEGAEEQLQPLGKGLLSHPLQEDSQANEAPCRNSSSTTESGAATQECLRDTENSARLNGGLQENSDSLSQNCCLGLDGASGEIPEEDQSSQGSPPAEDGKLKPGSKRVTFPSDEDIVSGAVEPKDPWRHGEKLDYKACEALEEIFKRLQFKIVDLEQTNLDEDFWTVLHPVNSLWEALV